MRHAFTLIELMAVVGLLGLIAGATAWSMTSQLRQASMQDVLAKVAQVDSFARFAAGRLPGRWSVRIDLGKGQMWREQNVAGSPQAGPVFELPAGYRFDKMLVVDTSPSPNAAYQRFTRGRVELKLDSNGCTSSYAVLVIGPDEQQWLFFAGLSGQVSQYENEQAIKDIFNALVPRGLDAD